MQPGLCLGLCVSLLVGGEKGGGSLCKGEGGVLGGGLAWKDGSLVMSAHASCVPLAARRHLPLLAAIGCRGRGRVEGGGEGGG